MFLESQLLISQSLVLQSDNGLCFLYISPLRYKLLVFLPGRSRGQRSRAGYRPRGRKRTGHNLEINSSNSSRQLTRYLSGHSGTDPRVYRLHITDEETGSERQSLRVSLCEGAEPMTQLLKQHQVTKRRPGRVLQCGAHQLL